MTLQQDRGEILAEGKTKIILPNPDGPEDRSTCLVTHKDDTSGGDGKLHRVIEGKGELVNDVCCNIFELLKRTGVPLAYIKRYDETSFLSKWCKMIPLEIVMRPWVHESGSFLKRYPEFRADQELRLLVCELFLKTTGKQWKGHPLPCNDPLLEIFGDTFGLYLPNVPLPEQKKPFMYIPISDVVDSMEHLRTIRNLGERMLHLLNEAFRRHLAKLYDFKFECGKTLDGEIVVADLISPDEFRATAEISKQGFRQGDPDDLVLARYFLAAAVTRHFLD